jgi:hypothetical protein
VLTYSATLDVPEETATLLVELLAAERLRRGTGIGARAASCRTQAVLVLRWFREDIGMPTLARDAGVSPATGYRYLHEGIDVLAARAPDLHSALEQGTAAGWSHVVLDGTLIRTDRCHAPCPTARRPIRSAGGPVVVGQARRPWRQRAGHRRPGWLADLDPARAARPRARHHCAAPTPRGCRCWASGPTTSTPPWPIWANSTRGRNTFPTWAPRLDRSRHHPLDRRSRRRPGRPWLPQFPRCSCRRR